MNKYLLIVTCFILLTASAATAQEKNKKTNPWPVKGYYGIGNNAAKLQSPGGVNVTLQPDTSGTLVRKGYYAIGKNQTKLSERVVLTPSASRKKPAVQKGYYGIGNNADKLKP